LISSEKKETIKFWVAIFLLVLVLMIVSILMIKYEVEGEKNMPFEFSKMVIISSAEGLDQNEKEKAKSN
jgi:1-acyl-sn-glycerol-3-phosphate acyltransferase